MLQTYVHYWETSLPQLRNYLFAFICNLCPGPLCQGSNIIKSQPWLYTIYVKGKQFWSWGDDDDDDDEEEEEFQYFPSQMNDRK